MRKMDEMEKNITLQAIKWSWFFTVLFLFVWQMYDWIVGNKVGIQGILFIGQFLVFFIIQQLLKNKVGDKQGKSNLIFFFVSAAVFLVVGCIAFFAFA